MDAEEVYSLAKRRGFFWPSFEIYGGAAGFFDYGPLGALLKRNIEEVWRNLYVVGEGCAEISCPNVAIEDVFKASGHLDEFSDLLVSCSKCQSVYRADKVLEQFLEMEIMNAEKKMKKEGADLSEQIAELKDGLSNVNDISAVASEISKMVDRFGVKCISCGGPLSAPEPFNLMFRTEIGPGIGRTGYLRPETAQAMFMDFGLIYNYFREKLPFGIVQIGRGFRNEISPRQGLFRMREFNMMEAEIFFDPQDKIWPRYGAVKDERIPLFYGGEVHEQTLEDAVAGGVIANSALAYFMHLTMHFLHGIGIDPKRLRFRQHGEGEMAHYASDCWDAEIQTSLGWVEAVGIADRGDFDVGRHIRFSGQELKGLRRYPEPREEDVMVRRPVMKILGPKFKGGHFDKGVLAEVQRLLKDVEVGEGEKELSVELRTAEGEMESFVLREGEDYTIATERQTRVGEKFIPHVIEPSYGLDRILYSIVEHAYTKEEEYTTLRFKPAIAPFKFGIFPLMKKDGLDELAGRISEMARTTGLPAYYDEGGSIGRRYARMDEIGTPYCITVDYQSKEDGTVTVRDRDSKEQVRVKLEDSVKVVLDLISGELDFLGIGP